MAENQVYFFTDMEYDETVIQKAIVESHVLDIIEPGQKVVIKPNFVQEKHDDSDDWDYVITHPVVMTAVIKEVCKKLENSGEIIIADAPMTSTRFEALIQHFPVQNWKSLCDENGIAFQLIDLRDEEWFNASNGIILRSQKLPGDPLGKVMCNLKDENSEFWGKQTGVQGFYGADYDIKETNDAHNGSDNRYSVSKTVISADVFINVPKLKAHKKAGMTCCLKNLVGINTNKNLLPHHSTGTPAEGGDQFDNSEASRKLESAVTVYAKRIVHKCAFLTPLLVPLKNIAIKVWGDNRKSVRSGGWYGNDTLWRTIIDLNKVMYYANEDGSLREDDMTNRKKYIAIVDGILAGEGNGPLAPDKVEAGFLLTGTNPVAVDCVAAWAMGFDYKKIPSVCKAFECKKYKLVGFTYDQITCYLNHDQGTSIDNLPKSAVKSFKAANGWVGHIEMDNK